jgi:hypothetical protein
MTSSLTPQSARDVETLKVFWQKVPFFGSRIEEYLSRYWYPIFLVPVASLIAWGFWFDTVRMAPHSLQSVTIILRDPYVITLFPALFLSAIAFTVWRSTIRQTFSTAIDCGIVSNSPGGVQDFLSASSRFSQLVRSPFRFIPITATIIATLIPTAGVSGVGFPSLLLNTLMLISLVAFSYAVGAVTWCFISTARWIASLSREGILRIQPGHPDRCCGLKTVGSCCLQSAVPLVIGMVLCLIWGNSRHLPGFSQFEGWSRTIIPFCGILLIVLFGLACALVFLPVQGLHTRLKTYKQARESEFTRALEAELGNLRDALATEDHIRVKAESDRLRLVQALDPAKLRLATWPFDAASLVKYGVTPLASLAVSLGKEVAKSLMP